MTSCGINYFTDKSMGNSGAPTLAAHFCGRVHKFSRVSKFSQGNKFSRIRGCASGFTMTEMMVVVAIIGILAAAGIPSMGVFLRQEKATSVANELLASLAYAKRLAESDGRAAGVCASTSGTGCDGTSWSSGWIVYSDTDNSYGYSTGDLVLRNSVANNDLTYSVVSGSARTNFIFISLAQGLSGGAVKYQICGRKTFPLILDISANGRATVQTDRTTKCA